MAQVDAKFGQRLSAADLKAKLGAAKIQVIRNDKKGTLFLVADGVQIGGVAKKYDAALPKEFVLMIPQQDPSTPDVAPEAPFWLLCNINTENISEEF